MVLVSQPTHPAFYHDDERQHRCGVCKGIFTCAPPTRHELMQSFTGPELGAMLEDGCVIGAHDAFSEELENKLEEMPEMFARITSYDHWVRSAYLITSVTEDDGKSKVQLDDARELDAFRSRLSETLELSVRGTRYRLLAESALEGVEQEHLGSALTALRAPRELVLASGHAAGDCGDDHVCAVNLMRPCAYGPDAPGPSVQVATSAVRQAVDAAASRWPAVSREVFEHVHVAHYVGGPCDEQKIVTCIVPGGQRGWSVVENLASALELAARRARAGDGTNGIGAGSSVRIHSLKSATDLNGLVGICIAYDSSAGRWLVRLPNGSGKRVKCENLTVLVNLDSPTAEQGEVHATQENGEAASPQARVLAFWGDARWSRTQLLGEIARGHWGLCKGNVCDIVSVPRARRRGLEGRLMYAPPSEMTEESLRDQMREVREVRGRRLGELAQEAEEQQQQE